MWVYLIKILLVAATSAFKFVFGFGAGVAAGLSFPEMLIANIGGGMMGVIIYMYLLTYIQILWRRFFPEKKKVKKKRKKTWFRKFIVVIVRKYKLTGVAFLTPILLSVPVGTVMATAMVKDKWKIKKYMLLAFVFWFFLLYGLYIIFDIRVDELF